MRKVEVVYEGPQSDALDKRITEAMEAIGAKWYAQGYDLQNDKRDIAFDIEE